MRIYCALIFLTACILLFSAPGCRNNGSGQTSGSQYRLPDEHSDNSNQLKRDFFNEPFVDLNGNPLTIEQFRGTPLVIMVFPFFRTDEGRISLLGLERLVKERRGQFQALVIPFEDKETILPAIKSDMPGFSIIFRADGRSNDTLIQKYSALFWDERIISMDYPFDPQTNHQACPFYWIVDRAGRIKEKLIDYSNTRGVRPVEVAMVLDALLGVRISEPEPSEEVSEPTEEAEPIQESAGTSN